MIIDYWRRDWRGEKDPVRNIARKFKLGPRASYMFFIDLNIDDMSPTKH